MKTQIAILVLITAVLSSCITMPIKLGELMIGQPGPTTEVKAEGWSKLKKGMSKAEVLGLLGETNSCAISSDEGVVAYEFYEYNWTRGFTIPVKPHRDSYVIYFDGQGRLIDWREPGERRPKDKDLVPDSGS